MKQLKDFPDYYITEDAKIISKRCKKEKELNWNYEGWGITHYNNQLIISTGSSNLYFVNPATLAIEKTLGVYDNNGYIASLNELEMIDGKIYANVWGENKIIAINPGTGQVEKQFDFTNILQKTKTWEEWTAFGFPLEFKMFAVWVELKFCSFPGVGP